ncbi:Radical SAM superfamily enzyme [Halalkaliarchaeum sp. AArc-CO]|uniref:TIGR04053 family radical SAM/SPASM domain-containing protein n=1 Tax=Halalkaliarchaeum sp. AArc-CO TaxID=2866381 RepID=UPI00217EEEE5|nr:TIGR04053 family radical SAM/SPASM domain-containing protein [Halalkaliarchaeum sp. AArc-CO]UWG50816.1 Radical SAM superfamily enzyme [Halalkaliarchaeum sp. AArc-CO]
MNPHAIDTEQQPFVLIWEVTQACELECKHCRADAQPDRHPDELTTAEAEAFLEDAAEFGKGQLVVLSGGDPLAREDLVDLVEYGTELGLRMTLTPSGTESLTPAVIDDLADAGLKRLAVSLDGTTATAHDEFRGEEGSFKSTMTAARHARDSGIPLQLNTTVCAETVEELPALADLAEELGTVLWSVFFLVPIGRGRILDPIDPERADRVMEWLLDQANERSFGVKTTEAPQYRRVAIQRNSDGSAESDDRDGIGRRVGIRAGDGFAFVSHLGQVYPSGFLPEPAGSVREESIVDIYRDTPLFERLREEDQFKGKCGACEFKHVCGGSRSRAYAYSGDPLESDPLCPYVPDEYDGPLPLEQFAITEKPI